VCGEKKDARAVNWQEGHKSSNAPPPTTTSTVICKIKSVWDW